MALYAGKTFVSTFSGKLLKQVLCDRCHCEYRYELCRVAEGKAESPYYLFQKRVREHAERQAAQGLLTMLKEDVELVPCPRCGHIPQDMAACIRAKLYRPIQTAGLWIAGSGLLGAALFTAIQIVWNESVTYGIVSAVISLAIGVAGILLRRVLASNVDLKDPAGRAARYIEGAPPALLPAGAPDADGNIAYEPAPRRRTSGQPAAWIAYPLLRVPLPDYCCECLAPTTETWKPTFNSCNVPIPLCEPCRTSLKRRYRIFELLSIAFALTFTPAVAAVVARLQIAKPWAVAAGAVLFIAIAAAACSERFLRPHRIKRLDASRGLYRLRFRNGDYMRVLQAVLDNPQAPTGRAPVTASAITEAREAAA